MNKEFRKIKIVKSEVELVKVSKNYNAIHDILLQYNAISKPNMPPEIFTNLLENIYFTFRMKLSRYQSLILCEGQYAYSVQSQRYCRYDEHAEVILEDIQDDMFIEKDNEIILDYLDDCLSVYLALSEIKEGSENKSKFRTDDFKYGIPIEDARYILPMAFTCNQIVTMTGAQLIDFLSTIADKPKMITIYEKLMSIKEVSDIVDNIYKRTSYQDLLVSKNIDINMNTNSSVELNFIDNLDIAGEAALTCTGNKIDNVNLSKVATRVAGGMKHTSILDHVILSYKGQLSIAAYNQLVRHRLQKINRLMFDNKILVSPLDSIIIPPSIKNKSDEELSNILSNVQLHCKAKNVNELFTYYFSKFLEMTEYFTLFTFNLDSDDSLFISLLPMGSKIRFIVTNDLSNELYICKKRTCMKAQWEIRNFTYDKLKLIIKEIGNVELFRQLAAPDCINDKCHEGKECCGDNRLVKNIFLNI